jgi:hypothetical protein
MMTCNRFVTLCKVAAPGIGAKLLVLAMSFLMPAIASGATTSYQNMVLSDGPYVYYRFNETSGTSAADTSGNGWGGTYVGSPTLGAAGASAPSDNAVALSGAAQHVDSTATGFGSLMNNSSYEFLFKTATPFPTTKQSLAGVFNTGTTSNSTTAFSITLNENAQGATAAVANSIRLFLRDGTSPNTGAGLGLGAAFVHPTILDGNYHHLLFTYDSSAGASRVQAYVDGVPQTITLGTGAAAGSTPTAFANFGFNPSFGARNVRGTVGQFFAGTIDEAALYAKTLTADDALEHASAIPEPATLPLFAVCLMGLALFAEKRRQPRISRRLYVSANARVQAHNHRFTMIHAPNRVD